MQTNDPAHLHADIDLAQVLNHLLKLTNRLMSPFTTHLEKRYRVSVNEFRLLMLIGRYGPMAAHELVELTGVIPMGISRAAAALVLHGRLQVDTDPSNRRRKILQLTSEGERLYQSMKPNSEKVAQYLFEALEVHEVMALDHFLRMMIGRLEAVDENGASVFLERTRPVDDPSL